MIDWEAKVQELKHMADELDYWATRSEKRGRMVLGRIADDLRLLAGSIESVLVPTDQDQMPEPLPEWLAEEVLIPQTEAEELWEEETFPEWLADGIFEQEENREWLEEEQEE